MIQCLAIFATQLVYVLLLGLQSRIVNWGGKAAAMCVSTCLGVFGLLATEAIARNALWDGDWPFRLSYVLAGPCGIAGAMWLHDRWGGRDG